MAFLLVFIYYGEGEASEKEILAELQSNLSAAMDGLCALAQVT